ncbi:MAG: transposase [Gammaproteobacteria bacterium]|nr:transposase [Gammaproteobacteria bacterium]
MMTDFELGAINTFRTAFPNADTNGCFFHLAQAMFRKVQQSGLAYQYGHDNDFASKVRQIVALAFVPKDDVLRVFDDLMDQEYWGVEFDPLLNYFENSFIGRPFGRGGRRRAPAFPLDLWNVHDRTKEGHGRTNNLVEAFNKRFSMAMGSAHPSIWKFIDVLKSEFAHVRKDYMDKSAGIQAPSKKNMRYVKVAEQLERLLAQYGTKDPRDYLKCIAYTFT